jgi:hypothetical protein
MTMMRAPVLPFLLAAVLGVGVRAAEETSKSSLSETIKARAAEDAKSGRPAGPSKSPAAEAVAHPAPPPPAPPAKSEKKEGSAQEAAKAKQQDPTVLDPVEVRKRKMTEFEKQTRDQEAAMIREKKYTTPTEMDKALNDSKVSKVFSIFGGQSGEQRANVAKERLAMMEEEKDIIEAIAHAKTKEEKQTLQKQLDELRKVRRELEKALR